MIVFKKYLKVSKIITEDGVPATDYDFVTDKKDATEFSSYSEAKTACSVVGIHTNDIK